MKVLERYSVILLIFFLLCGCQKITRGKNIDIASESGHASQPEEEIGEEKNEMTAKADDTLEIEITETPEPEDKVIGQTRETALAAEEIDPQMVSVESGSLSLDEPIYVPSANFPFPDGTFTFHRSRPYTVGGMIESSTPLREVKAVILKGEKEVLSYSVEFEQEKQVLSYELVDLTYSRDISCLSEQIEFQKLHVGDYCLKLFADTFDGKETEIASGDFSIDENGWAQLLPNNLRGNYDTAYDFFGDDKFLFQYKMKQDGTNAIKVSGEWTKQYISSATMMDGKKWTVHVDAVPYYEAAGKYLENTYIHVHGTNGDTGVLQLAKTVELNGTFVPRFVNSGLYISHHSFGTAVDINAYVSPNRDVFANREWIYEDVTENLVYNGIEMVDGVECYDFTYSGSEHCEKYDVPDTVLNYLIYELAFYRAGFSWGVYYPHTSDAMHFSLTELSPELFESGPYAMRKVFEYIWEPSDAETAEAPIEQ